VSPVNTFFDTFRQYRRWLKSKLPFVRRREYRKLEHRYDAYLELLSRGPRHATDAKVRTVMSRAVSAAGDLCLFVSHAPHQSLKPHVVEHIEHLLDAGIEVVLIVNTDLDPDAITIPPGLLSRLTACHVRENVGFDFAAWVHSWFLCGRPTQLRRLLLVNDSIVGPLDSAAFQVMVRRMKDSKADLIGLTENTHPRHHVQSFFLVLSSRALQTPALLEFLDRMHALPTKDMVIELYETRLTALVQEAGLSVETLFPALSKDPWATNDTFYRWAQLIRAGFPYIKASVLSQQATTTDARALIPVRFRDTAS
jgi:lipopolysaccharide biosynthesis protein